MSKAIVVKSKRGRGKQSAYAVKQNGRVVKTYEDNGKLGWGGARDLAQKEARRINSSD
jgi:hypothetical protein